MAASTIQTLNRLLALHASTLPAYLVSAPPHRGHGDERVWDAVRRICDDQALMTDKIADLVEELGGTPNMGEFPMEFTGMHDLSMDYMAREVLKRQKRETGLIEELSARLDPGSRAKALAQEALGAAKAHVESLDDSLSSAV